MDEEGVCISAGSACAASAEKPSHVISALGIPKEKSLWNNSNNHRP